MPFNANDYNKRVLTPAVEAFKNGGGLPDVFERYDLPTTVSNTAEIETTTQLVSDFWNKNSLNPRDQIILSKLRAQHAVTRRDLLDPTARNHLREIVERERTARREERFKEVDARIGLVAAKGYVTAEEKTALAADFAGKGLTEAEILGRIQVKEKETEKIVLPSEGLLKPIRDKIKNSLAALNKRTLYDFLGVPPEAPKALIEKKHAELAAVARTLKAGDEKGDVERALSLVKQRLIDDDPAKYLAALAYEKFESFRAEVKFCAADKIINLEETAQLKKSAARLGFTEQQAEGYIRALAQEFGASVEFASSAEVLICSNCQAARPKKEERCGVCSKALWMSCPKCSKRVPASLSVCGQCGFQLHELPRVRLLIRRVQLAVEGGDATTAIDALSEIDALWPEHPEVPDLRRRADAALKQLDAVRGKLDEALRAHLLTAAREHAIALARSNRDHAFSDGRTPAMLLEEIERELKRAQGFVDSGQEHERQKRPREAALDFQRALSIADDASAARAGLGRIPPEPCGQVRVSLSGKHVVIDWTPSTAAGSLRYRVVRSSGRGPVSPQAGELSGAPTATNARDEKVPPGTVAYYGVFTGRSGTFSKASVAGPILVASEVEGFTLSGADGVVNGNWRFPGTRGRVRVWRQLGRTPSGPNDGTEVRLSGRESFVDTGLRNGAVYYYRTCVEYDDGRGGVINTPGVFGSARPDETPQPVSALKVGPAAGGIQLSWSAPARGSVSIYRVTRPPAWAPGTLVPVTALTQMGAALRATGATTAVDPAPAAGQVFYVPVTVSGDNGILGTPRSYTALPDIADVKGEDLGRYLQLTWSYPRGCDQALVAWRGDAFPTDADDSAAQTKLYSKSDYERLGGFRLENPEARPYYFAVFAGARSGDATLFGSALSEGSRALLRDSAIVELTYQISRSFWNANKLTITLSTDGSVVRLPDLVVVAKPGDVQPLRATDGLPLKTLSGLLLTAGAPLQVEVDAAGIRRPYYVRALFAAAESHQRFQLKEPTPSKLRFS